MQALLKLLQDGRFHSGEALGAALGVSRSAVWKKLQGLHSEFGIEVFRVPGKGYRLAQPLKLLDADAITRCSPGLDSVVHVLPSIDSTNAEVIRRLDAGVTAPFCVLAERQTAGRVRHGFIGDAGCPGCKQVPGLGRIRRQMQIGKQRLPWTQALPLLGLRLLDLDDQVAVTENLLTGNQLGASLPV